jgi:hypothetical protein
MIRPIHKKSIFLAVLLGFIGIMAGAGAVMSLYHEDPRGFLIPGALVIDFSGYKKGIAGAPDEFISSSEPLIGTIIFFSRLASQAI